MIKIILTIPFHLCVCECALTHKPYLQKHCFLTNEGLAHIELRNEVVIAIVLQQELNERVKLYITTTIVT